MFFLTLLCFVLLLAICFDLVLGPFTKRCKVWDETLAKSAEAWAATCIWDHGPSYLLRFLGQNLSVRTGRYRSILQLVKPWYDEVKDYAFPYPQDCNPRCPMRCYGPMCTHYTQVIKIIFFYSIPTVQSWTFL
ncbi:peptidase inhibitor 15 [Limosa lapponica baueri]|uniref:Peptidase inhibitor 15 n=1 Tax=Limosa lapponica baueri TaxID=1758121 RepID=A0A2I0T1E3_LIMLA|nr:peptidase inhibitor 15 [Limosa lapponica baueri]